MSNHPVSSRSGAALVIAIVVLAAMLLIGLPFLFTQSGSLSGTRSYSHGRLASMGQDSAQSMGVAAGASAVSYHWQQDGVTTPTGLVLDDWTDLFHDLNGSDPLSGLRRVGVNRIEVDTRNHVFALPGERFLQALPAAERDVLLQRYPTVVGLSIEDESGKLDPNFIDMRGWSRLLQQVGITDWPDGRTPQSDPAHQQLARTLGSLRYELPGGRITAIDQLLFAEPPLTIPGTTTPVPNQRRSLTRTELERLRPYLTLSVPAQARGGLIDLGTVIGVSDTRVIMLDHDKPETTLAFAEAPLLTAINTALVFSDVNSGTLTLPAFGEAPRLPLVRAAAAIDAPPVLNLHQAEPVVRNSFAPSPLPAAQAPAPPTNQPQPALLTGLHALPPLAADAQNRPRSPFDLVSPLAVVDTMGSTHVLASRQGDNGVTGPFDANLRMVDGSDPPFMLLDARATVIHIVTGSLERFPQRGFALIKGTDVAGQPAEELIEYTSSSPILPLSATAAAERVEVTLYVRRGLSGAAKTFRSGTNSQFYDQPADLHLTALATREQQPLGIASQGVITIASTSTVTDPAGNQTAQEQHRVIAQALPQESIPLKSPLEARWDKQVTLHALLAQRHGSLLATFPRPNMRLTDILPQDAPNVDATGKRYLPPFFADDPDASVGMKPALMRSLLKLSPLDVSYRMPFSGTGSNAVKDSRGAAPIPSPTGTYTDTDLSPEGLRLDDRRVLYYPNPGNSGFLRDGYTPATPIPALVPLESITGRQFGLWIRPDKDWDQPVVLFDCQMPDENVSESLSGVPRPDQPFDERGVIQKGASNLFRLAYLPAQKLLILYLNPGTVQQAAHYGPLIPRELFGDPGDGSLPLRQGVYPAVNPECLGFGGVHRMASAPPNNVQSIQQCYYVGDRLVSGEWNLIQVAFTSNQPGGMSIIVDGLVGRDVTRLASAANPRAMTVPGDHVTLPSLVLRTSIGDTPTVAASGARELYLPEIQLDAIARSSSDGKIVIGPSAVRDVLPPRGIIRIADEYISYEDISSDGKLLRCVRGRRQRTDAGSWGGAHQLQKHSVGDLVVPGGFAMKNLGGDWWRGGCSLKFPLPDGDRNNLYRIAVKLSAKAEDRTPILEVEERAGVHRAQLADLRLQEHGFLLWNKFIPFQAEIPPENPGDQPTPARPAQSIPHLLYFIRDPALPAKQLRVWHWNHASFDVPVIPPTDPPTTITIPDGWVAGIPHGQEIAADTDLILVSTELEGDPTAISRSYDWVYADRDDDLLSAQRLVRVSAGREDYDARMVQLYDARDSASGTNGGRAEWNAYTSIESRLSGPDRRKNFPTLDGNPGARRTYLMNLMQMRENGIDLIRGGFWFNELYRTGARARQRTAFAASDFADTSYDATTHRFPAGTRVIPVQTTITSPDAQAAGKDPYPVTPLLEAGDMVTLAPVAMGVKQATVDQRPRQMCVRYSANDGFPETKLAMPGPNDPVPWNVMNRYFAFTEAIPADWNPGNQNFHLLAWPCWTPEVDLSPSKLDSWALQRLGWVLPWGTAYAPDFRPNTSGDDRPIAIGLSTDPANPGIIATIDAIHAGGTSGWIDETNRTEEPTELVQANILPSSPDPWILDEPLTVPLDIQVDAAVFAWPYGLVDIGGEVFAYKRLTPQGHGNKLAQLIGRSLLGSIRREHQGRELILHLPIGPVAEVIGGVLPPPPQGQPQKPPIGLPIDRVGAVQFTGSFAAPAMLLTSRNGETMELTTMPHSHTAPWLRGMYNTTPVEWEPRISAAVISNLAPLAIGWWPRYPSAFPQRLTGDVANTRVLHEKQKTMTLTTAEQVFLQNHASLLRSRSYAWAGFPLRFHNCQFTTTQSAMVTVLSNGDGLFDIQALALDATLDWSAADLLLLLAGTQPPPTTANGAADPIDASQVFATDRFLTGSDEIISPRLSNPANTPRPVDGAELRVVWTYSAPATPSTISPAEWLHQAATNGNRAPMIGPVYLRTRAPNKVLNVER